MSAGVEIFIDLPKYVDVLSDNLAQRVSSNVRTRAKRFVAVRSRRLQNSIRVDKLAPNLYVAIAETPYALAQEFGRPDLPVYTFTPYMRPAARKTADIGNLRKLIDKSSAIALKRSKKK
jgi:hypothetical protein